MDQALPADMPITLVIKAPNQRMADQTVDCMLGWTIRKLKQHLEKVYPSKPKHNEQRLIYSGKLLQDHLTLKEILRQYDENEQPTRHTVHLVCSKSSDSSTNIASKSCGEQQKMTPSEITTTSSSGASNAASPNSAATTTQEHTSTSDGLRYRGTSTASVSASPVGSVQQPVSMSNFGVYPPAYGTYTSVPTSIAAPAGYSPDQYAWLMQQQQQAYSQYMMQYMQYYQNMYYSGQPFDSLMGVPPSYTQQQQPQGNPAVQPQQPQPQQAAARPNNDANDMPRMNAQGGVDQDDENDLEPRDWLHHVYFIMRFLTFMGFLFFYSNPTRFLLVFSGSVAIYFLQKIRRHMQRIQQLQEQERQQQEAERQRQQAEQQQQQQQDNPGGETDGSGTSGAGHRQQDMQNPAQDGAAVGNQAAGEARSEPRVAPTQDQAGAARQEQDQGNWVIRAFVFVCMTIQAFFTSLLPTPPELLEAN
ncbi:homocysteine-responsive endoplasmic reticulum-resident ubiquitin-like domain member 2 protein [Elysia marginata]|uniref:Homocysteine-responsive endoplasmic reticulum-resident ubiquitin-like domain member 2 protein n=1 Tax=Elysia marginata TaxID=1093978 RepID=A0AAV4J4F4_9GAST|nr:homocysteine-responsive endoplasmic reticulum-resident ubiquitin-like domain member 2 protein [Elysia marginata]